MNFSARTLSDHQLRISARPDAVMVLFGLPFLLVGGYMLFHLPFSLAGILMSESLPDFAVRLVGLVILVMMILMFGLPGLILTTGRRTVTVDAARGEVVERDRWWLRWRETHHSTAGTRLVILKYDRIAPSSTRNHGERDHSCYHLDLVWSTGKTVNLALHDKVERLQPWGESVAEMLRLEFRNKERMGLTREDETTVLEDRPTQQ
jgi:hypothetical protein